MWWHVRLAACAAVVVAILALPAAAHGAAILEGRVTLRNTDLPVPAPHLALDLEPRDGVPEIEGDANLLGHFDLNGVPPGSYRLTITHPGYEDGAFDLTLADGQRKRDRFELDPRGDAYFPLHIEANDVRSGARLPHSVFAVEGWNNPAASGTSVYTRTLNSGGFGRQTFLVPPGYYRITASRPGWETLVHPDAGTVPILRAHSAVASLKPVGRTLRVAVRGFDPVEELPQFLRDVTVEISGYDFDDVTELVPPRALVTDEEGQVVFQDLAAIRWHVIAKKHGYEPATASFYCDAESMATHGCNSQVFDTINGTTYIGWNVQMYDLSLHFDTQVTAELTIPPYTEPRLLNYTQVNLLGIEGTPTEGIWRYMSVQIEDGKAFAEATDILPGRYLLSATRDAGVGAEHGVAPDTGGMPAPYEAFKLRTQPFAALVEVADEENAVVPVKLVPRLAEIRGRLLAGEALRPGSSGYAASERDRFLTPRAATPIDLVMQRTISILSPQDSVQQITTDSSGHFHALVLPGFYGLEIPTLAGYSGHQLILRKDGVPSWDTYFAPRAFGWPYADPWPYTGYLDDYQQPGLSLDGGQTYEVDIIVHKNFLNLSGSLTVNDPFSSRVLSRDTSIYAPDIAAAADVVQLDGPTTIKASLRADAGRGTFWFEMQAVPPGTYLLSGNHARYDFSSFSGTYPILVTIPAFPAFPGDPMPIDPYADGNALPGWRYGLTSFTMGDALTAENNDPGVQGGIPAQTYCDVPQCDPPQYLDWGSVSPSYYEAAHRPGELFTTTGLVPSSGCIAYVLFQNDWSDPTDDEWARQPCDGSGTIFINGPDKNISASNAPGIADEFSMDLRTRLGDGTDLAGLQVKLGPSGAESTVTSGGVVQTRFLATAGAEMVDNRWQVDWSYCEAETHTPRCTLFVVRQRAIAGKVVKPGGAGVPDVRVAVLDRMGTKLGDDLTDATGAFNFSGGEAARVQPIWLELRRPGFRPVRKRFDPTPNTVDVTGVELVMQPLPAPTLDEFSMDRFGYFLPGVRKSGDPGSFSPNAAAQELTLTWRGRGLVNDVIVTMDALDPTGLGPATEQVRIAESIESAMLVDRRAFASLAVNALGNPTPIDPVALADRAAVDALVADISARERGGQPFFVFSSNGEPTGFANDFTGHAMLSDLPPGPFEPLLLLFTSAGAVGVFEYVLPADKKKLEGVPLPDWAAFMTDIIGSVSAAGLGFDVKKLVPVGSIIPLPEFTSVISLKDGYVGYKYSLGVVVSEGTKTPASGLLSLGLSRLGISLKGTLVFELSGEKSEAALGAQLALTENFVKDDGLVFPGVVEKVAKTSGLVTVKKLEFTGTGTIAIKEKLGPPPISAVSLQKSLEGFVEGEVAVDLTPFTGKIPYVGPFFILLDKAGIRLDARLGGGSGMKITGVTTLSRPHGGSGTTTTTGQPQRMSFIGQDVEAKFDLTTDILWKAVGGLGVTGRKAVDAMLGIQIGAPADQPGKGVAITLNELGTFPPVKRVKGAVSIAGRVELSGFGIKVSRKFQWDGIKIDWQPNTEPYFDLVPTGEQTIVVTPATAPPAVFRGGAGGVLLDDLYGGSSCAVTGEASGTHALVWVETQPGSNAMRVMFSRGGADGAGFAPPEVVATGGVILGVAAAEKEDGTWVVAWSEIAVADLGNPFAQSTIKYATAASPFSAAQVVAAQTGAVAHDLKMAAAGAGVVLSWLEAPGGPFAAEQALMASRLGSAWSAAAELRRGAIASHTLAGARGASSAAALAVAVDGERKAWGHAWSGSQWDALGALAEQAGAVDVAFDSDGAAWLAAAAGHKIGLQRRAPGGGAFVSTAELEGGAAATSIAVLPLEEGSDRAVLVAWTEAGEASALRYAFFSAAGALVEGPFDAARDVPARFFEVRLVPETAEAHLAARAIVRVEAGDTQSLREYLIEMGEPPVLPDGGTDAGTDGAADVGVDGGVDGAQDGAEDSGDDAGAVDGGVADAGEDGAAPDGDGAGPGPVGGCSCGGGSGAAGLVLLLLALPRLRRRRAPPPC